MKETRYKADPQQPYGLHDCKINCIEIADGNLTLVFKDEITRIKRPGVSGLDVHGKIVVEGIDSEFCDVIIQGKGGSRGGFRGERLTIAEFTEKYRGWLWMPNVHPKEMTLNIGYFKGDVVYYTDEE